MAVGCLLGILWTFLWNLCLQYHAIFQEAHCVQYLSSCLLPAFTIYLYYCTCTWQLWCDYDRYFLLWFINVNICVDATLSKPVYGLAQTGVSSIAILGYNYDLIITLCTTRCVSVYSTLYLTMCYRSELYWRKSSRSQ